MKRGASVIEYGVVLGLIGLVSMTAASSFGRQLADLFSSTGKVFSEARAALASSAGDDIEPIPFIIEVSTDEATIYPMAGGSIQVDWGDPTANSNCGQSFSAGASITCAYPAVSTYLISISGNMKAYGSPAGATTNHAITRVVQWGNTGLTNLNAAFHTAENLIDVPDDFPSTVTSVENLFRRASTLNDPSIALWDVSNVANFSHMFGDATTFNVDISGWDVSSGLNMPAVFLNAENFNQDIGGWDVSSATNMQSLFRGATAFSYDLNSWDVSNVQNMQSIFRESAYNGDISNWDTEAVTNFRYAFQGNSGFDQNISGWNVSNVVYFNNMFQSATGFSQDITGWDVSSATEMDYMFWNTYAFTEDLSGWCVSGILSSPTGFSSGSSMAAEPIWGSCP